MRRLPGQLVGGEPDHLFQAGDDSKKFFRASEDAGAGEAKFRFGVASDQLYSRHVARIPGWVGRNGDNARVEASEESTDALKSGLIQKQRPLPCGCDGLESCSDDAGFPI